MAQLVGKLQQLQASNPAKAKAALTQLAAVVRDDQKTATGKDAQRLGGLADALESAADSGDLSSLAAHASGGGGSLPAKGSAAGAVDADGDHDGSKASASASSYATRAYAAAGASGGQSEGRALMQTLDKTVEAFASSVAFTSVSVTA